MFQNRIDAAERLAERLASYKGTNPLVLGIPRGGVPMAKHIAHNLGGELDVVLVRKLRAPLQQELAIGSVDESGWTYLTEYVEKIGLDHAYIDAEKQAQLQTIQHRRSQYRPIRAPIDPAGRIVIVVDDGLATGSTMIAALHGLRIRGAEKLVCAVAVSPQDTLGKMCALADQVICLESPLLFQAVGDFFEQFPQVTDEEVIEALEN